MEKWKTIPKASRYEVSDCGRIRYRKTGAIRKLRAVKDGHITVYFGGYKMSYQVHRLVLEAFIRPAVGNEFACHINGRPADNRLSNLYWGTPQHNYRDKMFHHVWKSLAVNKQN